MWLANELVEIARPYAGGERAAFRLGGVIRDVRGE